MFGFLSSHDLGINGTSVSLTAHEGVSVLNEQLRSVCCGRSVRCPWHDAFRCPSLLLLLLLLLLYPFFANRINSQPQHKPYSYEQKFAITTTNNLSMLSLVFPRHYFVGFPPLTTVETSFLLPHFPVKYAQPRACIKTMETQLVTRNAQRSDQR